MASDRMTCLRVETGQYPAGLCWPDADLRARADVRGYEDARRSALVVDDVAASRAVLADLLREPGFETHEASNGRAGLELATSPRPDLILMDSVMPVKDGERATRLLRRAPGLKRAPIIVISPSVTDSHEERSRAAGADAFVCKPVTWRCCCARAYLSSERANPSPIRSLPWKRAAAKIQRPRPDRSDRT